MAPGSNDSQYFSGDQPLTRDDFLNALPIVQNLAKGSVTTGEARSEIIRTWQVAGGGNAGKVGETHHAGGGMTGR